ncbi:Uncharacterized protein APZ42_029424 [Daphnia magna]|uniref:Uncharacterized protein n=1 Tax=Daphnia magna TaxID=35525 RepID=A0A164PK36_9CRUS|nr:Uncharacterized protein APZ42_029424 [Daphnia magna]
MWCGLRCPCKFRISEENTQKKGVVITPHGATCYIKRNGKKEKHHSTSCLSTQNLHSQPTCRFSPSSWFAWPLSTLTLCQPLIWSALRPMTAPSSSLTVLEATLPGPPLRDTHTPPSLPSSSASSHLSESPITPSPLPITAILMA